MAEKLQNAGIITVSDLLTADEVPSRMFSGQPGQEKSWHFCLILKKKTHLQIRQKRSLIRRRLGPVFLGGFWMLTQEHGYTDEYDIIRSE
jgi:hypothetical protein